MTTQVPGQRTAKVRVPDNRQNKLVSAALGGNFAPMPVPMIQSPAYRSLSLLARAILVELVAEWRAKGMRENGNLIVTLQLCVDAGLTTSSDAVQRARLELLAKGFLVSSGHRSRETVGYVNLFALTFLPVDPGDHDRNPVPHPLNLWKKWSPERPVDTRAAAKLAAMVEAQKERNQRKRTGSLKDILRGG